MPGMTALSAFALAAPAEYGDTRESAEDAAARAAKAESLALGALDQPQGRIFAMLALADLAQERSDWLALKTWLDRAALEDGFEFLGSPRMIGFLRSTGRNSDAAVEVRALLDAYPAATVHQADLGWLFVVLGEFANAEAQFERVRRYDPDNETLVTRVQDKRAFFENPRTVLAEDYGAYGPQAPPPAASDQCRMTFLEEKRDGGKTIERVDAACGDLQSDRRARFFAQLGDTDRAFDELQRTFSLGVGAEVALFYPEMAPLRRDERFWAITADLGLAQYWVASKQWPDFCFTQDLPVSCEVSAARAVRAAALKHTD
jgi:tetratricopeptide (TPR) repeat protein